jgi:hypothetical protein
MAQSSNCSLLYARSYVAVQVLNGKLFAVFYARPLLVFWAKGPWLVASQHCSVNCGLYGHWPCDCRRNVWGYSYLDQPSFWVCVCCVHARVLCCKGWEISTSKDHNKSNDSRFFSLPKQECIKLLNFYPPPLIPSLLYNSTIHFPAVNKPKWKNAVMDRNWTGWIRKDHDATEWTQRHLLK